jgi:hypothetical protein
MPLSSALFKRETKECIKSNINTNVRILDIGVGVGTYADLLANERYIIDGIEIYTPYVDIFKLEDKYDTLFVGDVRKQTKKFFDKYGLIILGDVLEHLSVLEAQELLSKLKGKSIIIAVPFKGEQHVAHGNEHEIHYQDDLTPQIFTERYPDFYPLGICSWYGVFTNIRRNYFYATIDALEEDIKFITTKFGMIKVDASPEFFIYQHEGRSHNVPKEYYDLLKEYPL